MYDDFCETSDITYAKYIRDTLSELRAAITPGKVCAVNGDDENLAGSLQSIAGIGIRGELFENGKCPTRLYQLGENYTGTVVVAEAVSADWQFSRRTKVDRFSHIVFLLSIPYGVLPNDKTRSPSHPILWEDVWKIRKIGVQARLLLRQYIAKPPEGISIRHLVL